MWEELWEIDVLESEVAQNIKFNIQEEDWERLIYEYSEMMQDCWEMQEEKGAEIKRLNWEVNELRCMNRNYKERIRQQQERKMKAKICEQKGDQRRDAECSYQQFSHEMFAMQQVQKSKGSCKRKCRHVETCFCVNSDIPRIMLSSLGVTNRNFYFFICTAHADFLFFRQIIIFHAILYQFKHNNTFYSSAFAALWASLTF